MVIHLENKVFGESDQATSKVESIDQAIVILSNVQIAVIPARYVRERHFSPEELQVGTLPPVPHPSKSSLMYGLYNDGELVGIRKIYGQAPSANKVRNDGQMSVGQGHSYVMTEDQALQSEDDIWAYFEQLNSLGVSVPALIGTNTQKIDEQKSEGGGRYLLSYDQETLEGHNLEDLFARSIELGNTTVMTKLILSLTSLLHSISKQDITGNELFEAECRENEMPLALDLKPNNFIVSTTEDSSQLWFFDLFSPGNRGKDKSTNFINRFIDQHDGDAGWTFTHERLIEKLGLYSKLTLELESIVHDLEIPETLKLWFCHSIETTIEHDIEKNDPARLVEYRLARKNNFAKYRDIAGRAERKRFASIETPKMYDVKNHVAPPADGNWPAVFLIVGPCRTGSTALQRALLPAGMPSYYQPLKHLRRGHEVGQDLRWEFPSASLSERIVIKETLGPYTFGEIYNPISELLDIGLPKNKLKVLVTLREPNQTKKSWNKTFDLTSAANELFDLAWGETKNIVDLASSLQVRLSYVFQHSLRDDGYAVMGKVCEFLGIQFRHTMIEWEQDDSGNRIIEPVLEPEWYAKRFVDPTGTGNANPIEAMHNSKRLSVPTHKEEPTLADIHPAALFYSLLLG